MPLLPLLFSAPEAPGGRPLLPSLFLSLFVCSRQAINVCTLEGLFSGSASAASKSCLLDSMMITSSSRAIVRYPTWIALTTSRLWGPLTCPAQGPAACGFMRPFFPEVTSYWVVSASSLACSRTPSDSTHIGPQPQARWPAVVCRVTPLKRERSAGDRSSGAPNEPWRLAPSGAIPTDHEHPP